MNWILKCNDYLYTIFVKQGQACSTLLTVEDDSGSVLTATEVVCHALWNEEILSLYKPQFNLPPSDSACNRKEEGGGGGGGAEFHLVHIIYLWRFL